MPIRRVPKGGYVPRNSSSNKKRYTTYLFPRHLAALEEIAALSKKTVTQVLSESLDTYLHEVGAIDSPETTSPSKEVVQDTIARARKQTSA